MPTTPSPSPWTFRKMDNGYGFAIYAANGKFLGTFSSNGAGVMGQSAKAKANARLATAAPELLAACKEIEDWANDGFRVALRPDQKNKIAAAIAKATEQGQ